VRRGAYAPASGAQLSSVNFETLRGRWVEEAVSATTCPVLAAKLCDCPAAAERHRQHVRAQLLAGGAASAEIAPFPTRCAGHVLPTCACGHRKTHRPEPGVGCTRPACLCLEPAEPEPRPAAPERVWLGAY
jgi:hypothetical protein